MEMAAHRYTAPAFLGRVDVAKLLLKNGAKILLRNNDGATPTDALSLNWETTVFIGNLVGIEIKNQDIETIQRGRREIAELFGVADQLEGEGTPSEKAVWEAASTGNLNVVKQALANGMDPNTKDPKSGGTLLTTAALMGHTEIVKLLLEHGAAVNTQSNDGGTALHAAAFLGRAETVKLLLEHGADTSIRHKMGGKAIDGAKLPWLLTKGILRGLKIEVDKEEVQTGRAEVKKLISQHNKK